jgi:hypothetical protein
MSPIAIEPRQGIRLNLSNCSKIRSYQGGGEFWELQSQQVIRQSLGDFLPRAEESGDSVLFTHFVNGREVCSESVAAGGLDGAAVPRAELQRLEGAVQALKAKENDPLTDPNAKKLIAAFKLPDPAKDPEFYRLYGPRWKRKLLVLWGVEKQAGSALVPQTAVARLPQQSSAAGWLNVWPWVLAAMALLAVGWFVWDSRQKPSAVEDSYVNQGGADADSSQLAGFPRFDDEPRFDAPNSARRQPVPETSNLPTDPQPGGPSTRSASFPGDTPASPRSSPAPLGMAPLDFPRAARGTPPAESTQRPSSLAGSPSAGPTRAPGASAKPTSTPAAGQSESPSSGPATNSPKLAGASPNPASPTPRPGSSGALPPPSAPPPDAASPRASSEPGKMPQSAAPQAPPATLAAAAPRNSAPLSGNAPTAAPEETPVGLGPATLEITNSRTASTPRNGKVEVLLNAIARDQSGNMVPLSEVSQWQIDGKPQTLNGKPVTTVSMPLQLSKGTHRVLVSGKGADGRPLRAEADVDVDIQVQQSGNVSIKPRPAGSGRR